VNVYLFIYVWVGVSAMASLSDDRRHLLADSDDSETEQQLRRRKTPPVRGVTDISVDARRQPLDDDDGSYSSRLRTIGDSDYVVAVFVVAFDTKAGLFDLLVLVLEADEPCSLCFMVTGTFVPTYFRSQERKFHGWNFRSLVLSLPGIFVPWNFRPLELSLPRAKIT